MKQDFSQDIREVRCKESELGERVSSMEDEETPHNGDIELLQQEIFHLREQQIDLQAHVEDLENRSCKNNIRIRVSQTVAEESDIHAYVTALFLQLLETPPEGGIKLNRVL
ncbi:hypothetical protein NDU88_006601 [Pleurodeles waltl]|uniref:Uncharacterized protein n=1 Tax=Pleurodeles waltl TaxID=8319 RepID=A0AAV7X482_PLEWA|nr:hypothetical protein NDU88_006601 [Pleurodeles waltl]